MDPETARLVADQVAYYGARAGEYDRDMWQRDRDDPVLQARFRAVDDWFATVPVRGRVLELGCGTGAWTGRLAERADTVLAVDAAPEMVAAARRRHGHLPGVTFVVADVFDWQPPGRFDLVFLSFLLSHVPPALTGAFWDLVAGALADDGTVAVVDAAPARAAEEDWLADGVVRRRLRDGSVHRTVKVFPTPDELTAAMAAAGLAGEVRPLADRFLVGLATRGPGPAQPSPPAGP